MKDIKIFDRLDILEILNKRLAGLKQGYRQNISLIGDELIGKTEILKYFYFRIDDSDIVPIYLELNKISFELFINKFIGGILYNYLKHFDNILVNDNLDFLLEKSKNLIPLTVEKINFIKKMVNNKRKKEEIFSVLISIPEVFYKETKKFIIIIFDEFQGIENFGLRKPYHIWSKIMILQKHTMYIISSSKKFKAQKILQESLTLLFGNFQILEINPFSLKAANEFICTKIYPYKLDFNLREFLISLTGGAPFYLANICREIVTRAEEANIELIRESDVIAGLQELLLNEWGALNQRFSNVIKKLSESKQKGKLIKPLVSIAYGNHKLKDIASNLALNKKSISSRLNQLFELDFIYKNGDFYYICDRVFGFWLKAVYKNFLSSLDFKDRENKFRKVLIYDMKKFSEYSKFDIISRIVNLLNLFSNELIYIENKKIRLTKFREIKPIEFKNKKIERGVIARSSDAVWLLAIKFTSLKEEDVLEFLSESKKFKRCNPKRIIISRNNSDSNVNILAKQEKVLLWSLDNLNHMFDIYNKPRIINLQDE